MPRALAMENIRAQAPCNDKSRCPGPAMENIGAQAPCNTIRNTVTIQFAQGPKISNEGGSLTPSQCAQG